MIAVHHEKSLVPAFFKVSVGHLYENRQSGKMNYSFLKKSCILDPKLCTNPVDIFVKCVKCGNFLHFN